MFIAIRPLILVRIYVSTHQIHYSECAIATSKANPRILIFHEIHLLLELKFCRKGAKRKFEYFLEQVYLGRRGERYVSFTTLRNYFDSILIPRTINTAVYVILYLTC